MKIALTALFTTLTLLTISAQRSPLAFGLSFTPKWSLPQFEFPDLGESEPQFGFDLQPTIALRLSDRLSLVSGLTYSFDRLFLTDYTITLGTDHDGMGGFDIYNSWFQTDTEIHSIGVPLQLKYHWSAQPDRWFIRAGYRYTSPIKQNVASQLQTRDLPANPLDDPLFWEATDHWHRVSFGVGYTIVSGGRTRLLLEPTAAYTLNRLFVEQGINSNFANNVRLLEVGLRLGVTW